MLITFDLDGVLMENPFSKGVFPEIKEILYNEYKENLLLKKPEKSENEIKNIIWQNIIEEYKKYSKKSSYKAYDWDMIIKNVSSNLGLKIDIDVANLVKKYCSSPYIKKYMDGVKLLKKLNRKKHELKIITNGYYKYQFPVVKKLGINHYFAEIISCDRAKSAKPEKRIFLNAVKNHNRENWVHIGDSILMDIYGANKLGGKTIFIDRNLPENIDSIKLEKRTKSNITKEYIFEYVKKEKKLNNIRFEKNKIYPDYIINNLEDLMKIL
ncbi:MAG: HAD family hydrolase [Bacillota bacterium]